MGHMKEKRNLKPIYEVQKRAHELYKVNPRTFQWYVTKGLIPRAIKIGREAFYNVDEVEVNVFDYIAVVKLLQIIYEMSTEEIKSYIDLYEGQLKRLRVLLQEISQNHPVHIPINEENWKIQNVFLLMTLGRDPVDLSEILIAKVKKEVNSGVWDEDITNAIQAKYGFLNQGEG